MGPIEEKQLPLLTEAERAVMHFVNENKALAAELSITELAERSFTSPATVSRAIRKCGYSGIPALRRQLAGETHVTAAPRRMNDILELSYRECTETIENLKINDILQIVQHMKRARKIYVLARGITQYTAQEFAIQLQLQRYDVVVITDSEIMKRLHNLMQKEDMLLIFTAFNSTPEFGLAAQQARKQGCTVAACCCTGETMLAKHTDYMVLGVSTPVVAGNPFNGASRLPLQIIARTMVEYLAN